MPSASPWNQACGRNPFQEMISVAYVIDIDFTDTEIKSYFISMISEIGRNKDSSVS